MDDKMIYIIFSVGIYIFWFAMYYFIDRFSRKGIALGVRVGSENMENFEVKNIKSEYKRSLLVTGLITSVLSVVITYYTFPGAVSFLTMIPVFAVSVIVYIHYSRRMKEWKKANVKEHRDYVQRVDLSLSKDKLRYGNIPWKLYIIPFLIIVLVVAISAIEYKNLPDSVPTHWGFTGPPDKYSEKSITSVFSVSIVSFFMLLIIMFASWGYMMMKQQNQNIDAKVGAKNIVRARKIWSYFIFGIGMCLVLMMAVAQLMIVGKIKTTALMMIMTVIVLIYSIVVPVILGLKVGNMGERLAGNSELDSIDDDKKWYFGGTIYYDKEDPAIFVPKRVGVGSTINFGNKKAMVGFILLLVLSIGIPIYVTLFTY